MRRMRLEVRRMSSRGKLQAVACTSVAAVPSAGLSGSGLSEQISPSSMVVSNGGSGMMIFPVENGNCTNNMQSGKIERWYVRRIFGEKVTRKFTLNLGCRVRYLLSFLNEYWGWLGSWPETAPDQSSHRWGRGCQTSYVYTCPTRTRQHINHSYEVRKLNERHRQKVSNIKQFHFLHQTDSIVDS